MRPSVFAAFTLVLSYPLAAHAEPSNELLLGNTLRWTNGRYGHAQTLVDATPDRVKQVMVDFGHYRELHPKFASARVIAKDGQSTDLYVRLPVKIGPVTIPQSEVLRFGPPRPMRGGGWILEGRGVKGDMKEGHIAIRVVPQGSERSVLTIDLLLEPNLPAPRSLLDEEVRDGAVDLANGMRDRAKAH